MASLCPYCYSERRRQERETEQPETRTIEVGLWEGSPVAQKAWQAQRELRMRAGEVSSGTLAERETLRWMDNARYDEIADLRETPEDRRRRKAQHWGRRLGVYTRQRYQPHPARAGR